MPGAMVTGEVNGTPIQQFYKDTKIFITGGTGFLGRILVEKLLRSCPDIDTIYLLARNKKGKDVETRLDEIFAEDIFDGLRKVNSDFRAKVKVLVGDCAERELGLSDKDKEMICNDVDLVFHAAATVNFDEKLQKATFINIRGTRDLLAICKRMKKLKFVTHVSTAYVHCTNTQLEEKFYEETYGSSQLIALAEQLDETTMENLKDKLLTNYPNTYAFTKSTSEDLIAECSELPIAIFRPAIIVSTLQEPIPGWINNFYGPQGVSTAAMVGLLRTLHCDEDVNSNIVPVDMAVNALIAIPWQARSKYDAAPKTQKTKEDIPIYLYESNTHQPINWKEFRYLTHFYGKEYPPNRKLGVYFFHMHKSLIVHTLTIIFMHLLPALIVDSGLYLSGKQPMLWKAYKKIHKFTNVISYFALKNWVFRSNKLVSLCDEMSPKDNEIFFCDLRRLDWHQFFRTYLKGCRTYLLKEDLNTVEDAKVNYRRFQMYHSIGFSLLALVLACGLGLLVYRLLL